VQAAADAAEPALEPDWLERMIGQLAER